MAGTGTYCDAATAYLPGTAAGPQQVWLNRPFNPFDMNKKTLNFWILFVVSIILSVLIISLFIKVLKAAIFMILVLILAPIIYIVLKLVLPGAKGKSEDDKLKSRP
jgi:uncharacterized Tic20 family protein